MMFDQSILVTTVAIFWRVVPEVFGVVKPSTSPIATVAGIDGVDFDTPRCSSVGVSSSCCGSHSSVSRSRCSRVNTGISVFVRSFIDHSNLGWDLIIIITCFRYLPLGPLWSVPEQAAGPGKIPKPMPKILLRTPWWLPGGRRLTDWMRADDCWIDSVFELLLYISDSTETIKFIGFVYMSHGYTCMLIFCQKTT